MAPPTPPSHESKDRKAVVVAQLVERLLPTPEIHRLQPIISKVLSTNCTVKNRKAESKEREAGNCPSLKKIERLIRDQVGVES